MPYQIIFSDQVANFIRKLDKSVSERVVAALERIRIRPEDFVEKLVGEEGYKLKIGDYRFFIEINKLDMLILVIETGHRRNIYKK